MRAKPYKAYKPSGVAWLGDVPAHWEAKRFGYLFRFFSGGTPSTDEAEFWEGDLPWVSAKDMKSRVITDTEDHISESAVSQSATCKLPAGSLLLVNRSGILKHTLPVAVLGREMAINQDIRGCVPRPGVDTTFIAYLVEGNQDALLALWRQQGATVESLNFELTKTTNLQLPPLPEQRAIVAFLDRETGRIDTLVAKKRELIERLQEKRTALISHAVTRGLDSKTKLNPSGLPWLGDAPAHWEPKRFGYLFRFISGGTPSTDVAEYWDGDLPWVSAKDMKSRMITDTEDHISEAAVSQSATCKLPVGSLLLVNRSGILKHSLPVAVLGRDMAINQDIRGCIPRPGVDTKFMAYLIEGNQDALLALWRQQGATVESLDFELIKTSRLILPPLKEQCAIVAFLEHATAKHDALVRNAEEAVERLQEYRTALITAAVTGKIDVSS